MVLELRDVLYFFMGVIAVCLVVSFSAYQLTTYDSVRGIIGDLAAQPTQRVNLHSQYNEMADLFNNARADMFTYHWGSQSVNVVKLQASGEQQYMGIVLNEYAKNLYDGRVTGDLATASSFAGGGANGVYGILSFVTFAAFFIILALSFVQQWYDSTRDTLRSAGKIILLASILAFIVFLVAPPIAESIMWGSLYGSDWSREVTNVVSPRITGALLVNTLIMVLFGALLYGAGFLVHINTGKDEPDIMGYVRSAPKAQSQAKAPMGKPGRRQL